MPRSARPHHRRSIFACMKCHRAKLKCDIMTNGNPCTRCRSKGITQCELYPSKRLSGRESTVPIASEDSTSVLPGSELQLTYQNSGPLEAMLPDLSRHEGGRIQLLDEGAQDLYDIPSMELFEAPRSPELNRERPSDVRTMLVSVQDNPKNKDAVDLFVDRAERSIDKDALVFFGESSPLAMLFRNLPGSGRIHLKRSSRERSKGGSPSAASTNSSASTVAGALRSEVLDELLSCYFHNIHPFYPVINRPWFAEKYATDSVPSLLLNAVCFAACYHCHAKVIFQLGYPSRDAAKGAFYTETKRLFDEGDEPDIIVVLQATVLLSFYGGKPKQVWNNRSWLAIAITIAEDLGIHRSISRLKMNDADKSHMRIIWWCIVFRDFMTALNFGRPPKTCDFGSDVEMLTLHEFEFDKDPTNPIFGKQEISNCHFLVENAKLNVFMMKVISERYTPYSGRETSPALQQELLEWRQNLPSCLDWTRNSDLAATYTCMIYHHMIIFVSRPRLDDNEIEDKSSFERAVKAASEISTLIGKLSVVGAPQIPQDMYSILVTAVSVLLIDVRANDSMVSRLQLQICVMALNQASDTWDHAPWVIKFFGNMIDNVRQDEDEEPQESVDDVDLLRALFSPAF